MRYQGSHSHRLLFLLVLSSFPFAASASVGPIFSFPSCSICPVEGDSPMNGDMILPVNTAGILIEQATCAQVEENAQDGDYSPFACIVLQQQVAEDCGCSTDDTPVMAPPTDPPVVIAPTDTPVVAPVVVVTTGMPTAAPAAGVVPTTSPVAPVTGVPTMSPVAPPTEGPVTTPVSTPVPTSAPVLVSPAPVTGTPTMVSEAPTTMEPAALLNTTVGVTFDGVTTLTEDMETALAASCEQYLAEQLQCAINLTCSIVAAPTRQRQRQRQLLRSLQTTNTSYIFVISGVTDELNEEEFTEVVLMALNNPAFVDTLNGTPGFESVTTITATPSDGLVAPIPVVPAPPTAAPVVVVPPTAAPVVVVLPTAPDPAEEDEDDGLSGGAIAGIIIGVAVGVALIGCGIYYASKGSSSNNATDREVRTTTSASGPPRSVEPISEVTKSDMMHPPPAFQATKIDKPPVAAAAAVAAAASGIFQGDPSIIKTGSQIGAETDASTVAGDTAASGAMSSLKQSMLCREVEAPPGKLGIVIDTTLEGPVVHKISADSPLEGVIFPGDIIVAINDVDTRAMSASAITALMARTSTSRRVLTVLSEDVSN